MCTAVKCTLGWIRRKSVADGWQNQHSGGHSRIFRGMCFDLVPFAVVDRRPILIATFGVHGDNGLVGYDNRLW